MAIITENANQEQITEVDKSSEEKSDIPQRIFDIFLVLVGAILGFFAMLYLINTFNLTPTMDWMKVLIIFICLFGFIVFLFRQISLRIYKNPVYIFGTLIGIVLYSITRLKNAQLKDMLQSSLQETSNLISWFYIVAPTVAAIIIFTIIKKKLSKQKYIKIIIELIVAPLLIFLSIDVAKAIILNTWDENISSSNIGLILGLAFIMLLVNIDEFDSSIQKT